MPWDDQGSRLLTVANYEHYMQLLDGLRERMVRERARFIEDYEDNIDQARLDLGKLFRIEDYPSQEALQGKFGIRYRITPVPDADHFMAKLASDDTDRVKRDIEHQIEERLHDAVGDLYRRLGEAVERVGERLREDDEGKPLVFRDSMIENIRGLVDVVPRLNIFGDDTLARPLRAGEGQDRQRRAGFAPPLADLRSRRPRPREARRRRADGTVRGVFRAGGRARGRARSEGRVMAARVHSESARRVSGCVTALLREQPFFGSLALRLPIRADASRETVASDGREIRYSPRWIAEAQAHVIETAMARVVLACALKHHTRRGQRDPERWQRASQLVTHGLLRDAGFTLPPDAEAWDGISVEQAYDRLPEPDPDDGDGDNDAPSGGGAAGADSAGTPPSPDSGGDDDSGGSDDGARDDDPQDGDGQETGADAPPSCDPAGTGEVMDAPADSGQGGGGPSPSEVAAEEQAWDEAMHQAASLAKAQGRMPGAVEETVRGAASDLPDEIAIKGRGGTDFRPGFVWLEEHDIQPGVCLYLTDMLCSSYPRPSRRTRRSGSITPNRPATGTANPGASASTSEPLRGPRREPGDIRRPGRGAQAGTRRPGPARLLDIVDRRPRSASRYPGEHPQHARGGGRAPQDRGGSRSGRRPCRSPGHGIRPG